ncbi:hypothetical protein ERJ75_000160600 [Trypanosoma vivax]|nr:hypothetical protein ERJ75_000160600 [Trypanosoma vivax]
MEEELEELASTVDTLREITDQLKTNSDDDETMEQYISRTMGNTGIFKVQVNADTLAEICALFIKSIKTYVYGISQKRTELEAAVIGVLKPALIAKVAECQGFYRSVSVSAHDPQSSASVSCKIFDNRLNAMQAGSNYSGYLTYLNERWDRASSEEVVNDIMKIAGGSGGLVELLRQPVDYIELSPPDRYEYNAGVILSIAVFILLVLLFACTAICCSGLCNCCSRSCETDRNATATAWCYERMPQETQFPQNYTTAVYMGKPVCTV